MRTSHLEELLDYDNLSEQARSDLIDQLKTAMEAHRIVDATRKTAKQSCSQKTAADGASCRVTSCSVFAECRSSFLGTEGV